MFNIDNTKKLPIVFEKSKESDESGNELLTEHILNMIEKSSIYSGETRSIKSSLTSASFPQRS